MPPSCRSCGEAVPEGARFCPACGRSLANASRTPAERRQVTVLFADAVGSTAFVERAGDEAAYRFVQRCVAVMSEAVERHGGTVTQFRGDGVMALFGAPVAQEHSAVEAVTAALDIQAALEAMESDCQFRLGLSTGPVVVGNVGDDVLLEYTAIGDTANVAARMEQSAQPGTVCISESTWRAVRGFIECDRIGPLEIKGKSGSIVAYQALRRRPVRSRLEAAVESGLGPFVGRGHEIDLLAGLVRDAQSGRGHVVEIVGEAGIGKSRLLLELRERLGSDVDWREGHCSADAVSTPYLAMADVLRRLYGIDEADDADAVLAKVEQAAQDWDPALHAALPFLRLVLDVDAGDPAVAEMDPRERRAGIIDALRVALLALPSDRPRVIALEDVHWADEASREVLHELASVVGDAAVVLVTTSRPGYESPFREGSRHTRLGLDALGSEAAAAISAAVLQIDRIPTQVAELIADRTEGNPLFVEELTAALFEAGLLVAEHDTCRLVTNLDDADVPATLHDVILARIDRLAREAKDALQLASVIGREFTIRLLDRLATLPDGLDSALDELKRVELIRQKSWFPELAYLFKHALTHEVTYSTLLDDRRRDMHRLVAQAIEDVYADRLAEHVDALARHWSMAEEWEPALRYHEMAAERAAAIYANEAATGFLSAGVEIARRIGNIETALRLTMALAGLHLGIGDVAAATAAYGSAIDLARSVGDDEQLCWALTMRGQSQAYGHDVGRAQQDLETAIGLSRASLAARQYASVFLVGLLFIFGRHEESRSAEKQADELLGRGYDDLRVIACVRTNGSAIPRWRGDFERCIDLAGDIPPGADLLLSQSMRWLHGIACAEAGRYDEALSVVDYTIESSTRMGETLFRARTYNTAGWIRGELADYAGAIEWNERCLAFLKEVQIPDEEIESNARLNLAETFVDQGRLGEAEGHLRRVEQIVAGKSLRDTWMLWRFSQRLHLLLARLELARGHTDGVALRIGEAVALAESSESRKYLVKAARIEAQLLRVSGVLDAAEDRATSALRAADALGHPPEIWRTHMELAAVADASGNPESARRHRQEADRVLSTITVSDPALQAGVARLRAAVASAGVAGA